MRTETDEDLTRISTTVEREPGGTSNRVIQRPRNFPRDETGLVGFGSVV